MNKKVFSRLLCVAMSLLCAQMTAHCWDLRFTVGAFIPQKELFRDIYGKAAPYYALEGTYYWDCGLGLWGNADFLSRHGMSLGIPSPTEIKIANFSLGLKIAWDLVDCMRVYAGVGPSVAGVWLKNRSICLCENISKAAGGVVLKTGFDWRFWDNFMVNLSADYLLEPVSFPRQVDIGGLKIGFGLGVTC